MTQHRPPSRSRDGEMPDFAQQSQAMSPFAFPDRLMEERYQASCVEGIVDRIRPLLLYFWLPITAFLRLFAIVYYWMNSQMSVGEFITVIIRFIIIVIACYVVSPEFSPHWTKYSLAGVWFHRSYFVMVAICESGIVRDTHPMMPLVRTAPMIRMIPIASYLSNLRQPCTQILTTKP
jgi:hypothetical protein